MFYAIPEKMKNVTGIGAGAVTVTDMPVRGVYHGVYLVCRKAAGVAMTRAEIIADVGLITLRVDGNIEYQASATVILDLFKYWHDKDGAFTVAGALPIPFTRPNLVPAAQKALLGWGMKDRTSFTLEVDIDAVATLVTIEVWAAIEPNERAFGRHLSLLQYPQTFAATGIHQITTLPQKNPDVGILAMHIGESTGDINSVIVQDGTRVIFDEVPMELNNMMLRQAGRTGQTDYYHVDFSVMDDQAGYLAVGNIRDFRQSIEWEAGGGAPGNYSIYIEQVRGLLGAIV